ncbi:alpha/beta hydrolase [Mesorhizobium muleiense]|uniref:alpha/beta hydrolase n=1 Tax=Mesorhizobium muleiense TaxID=1004279 RepID=UPI001F2F4A12|nr:alpha/beta hydrolase [Mesorhizobium muleiense]MCF6108480.1 alpha/beta hydrolase [Mesorhizobium muleiense]
MQRIIDFLTRRRAMRAASPARPLAISRDSFAPVGQLRPLSDDIAVDILDAGGVAAYWLTPPEAAASSKVVLYLHGGGYYLGSLRSHGPMVAHIGRATARRVLFPEYRLSPEHPFPAAFDDTLATWRWLVATAGIDPAQVILAGDSVGASLALALLHAIRDAGEKLPAATLLISPLLDLTASGASMTTRAEQDPVFTRESVLSLGSSYLNGADARNPIASPLFASHATLPPLLIQVGGAEVLVSDSERLAEAAAKLGVDVKLHVADGLPHVYHGALDAPETAEAIDQIVEFASRF